jgi:hypothetical protein
MNQNQHITYESVRHTYSFQPFGAKNATAGQAIMVSSMTNGFAGKKIKPHKWRNWMNNANKQNRTTTDPRISRPSIATTTTNVRIAIPIVIRIRTKDPEMIALDQTRVIAPTPNGAVHAAQVAITTETVHTSTMTKRNTKPTQCTLRRTTHDIIRS